MKYKVVPFIASLNHNKNNNPSVAEQLQALIDKYVTQGWRYVRLESVTTWIEPDTGCFGLGAKPGYTTSRQMAVFVKELD